MRLLGAVGRGQSFRRLSRPTMPQGHPSVLPGSLGQGGRLFPSSAPAPGAARAGGRGAGGSSLRTRDLSRIPRPLSRAPGAWQRHQAPRTQALLPSRRLLGPRPASSGQHCGAQARAYHFRQGWWARGHAAPLLSPAAQALGRGVPALPLPAAPLRSLGRPHISPRGRGARSGTSSRPLPGAVHGPATCRPPRPPRSTGEGALAGGGVGAEASRPHPPARAPRRFTALFSLSGPLRPPYARP